MKNYLKGKTMKQLVLLGLILILAVPVMAEEITITASHNEERVRSGSLRKRSTKSRIIRTSTTQRPGCIFTTAKQQSPLPRLSFHGNSMGTSFMHFQRMHRIRRTLRYKLRQRITSSTRQTTKWSFSKRILRRSSVFA
jgi:hypothetical protein